MNILPWLPSGDSRAKTWALRAIILSSLGLFLKLFAENQMMLNTKFIAISLSLYCPFSGIFSSKILFCFCKLFEPQYNFGFLSCESEISTIVKSTVHCYSDFHFLDTMLTFWKVSQNISQLDNLTMQMTNWYFWVEPWQEKKTSIAVCRDKP